VKIGERNDQRRVEMRAFLKADFWRLPSLIFLLFLPLFACTTEYQSVADKFAPTEKTVSKEKSRLAKLEAATPGLEESAEGLGRASLTEQPDPKSVIPVEQLGWNDLAISENCQADNDNLPQIDFPDPSICELQNFKLFLDRFSEDADFQISVTKFPLKRTYIFPGLVDENGLWEEQGREKITCLNLPKNSKASLIFPIKEQRESDGYKFSYTLKDMVATVTLQIEDSGYSVLYIFNWDKCWVLSEIKDYST
jgi:hypothetical protein